MKRAEITFGGKDGQLECLIEAPSGHYLILRGTPDLAPAVVDENGLHPYRALCDNAWSSVLFSHRAQFGDIEEVERAEAEKRAASHRKMACEIAALVDEPVVIMRTGWCSSCFEHGQHQKVRRSLKRFPTYACRSCGTPTTPCFVPGCDNMAVRDSSKVPGRRFCAEHRHDIAGFESASRPLDSLIDYQALIQWEQPNLARWTKVGGTSVTCTAVAATGGLALAPALGGTIGTLVGGYSGAAASSYGLALLGGGSVASGGFGMLGGTAVVAAAGGALGGTVGASVTNAYLREDEHFRIEQLTGGDGVAVVVCNGFLTESESGWGDWENIVRARYPDSPVFRVCWGSKELKALGLLMTRSSLKAASMQAIKTAASSATKAGSKALGPVGPALVAAELIKNPWHVARSRANKTGATVADLIARTRTDRYVLIGHSLGARAMCLAAEAVATKPDAPRLDSVHLLGAAISDDFDTEPLASHVDGAVFNYHSRNDLVLGFLYQFAQGKQTAAGFSGFTRSSSVLQNVDVSDQVSDHSEYHANVKLR